MRHIPFWIIGLLCLGWLSASGAQDYQRQYDRAIDKLNRAITKAERFYALGPAAKTAFNVGNKDQAKYLAEELLNMTGYYLDDWNYGNAVQDVHVVLGRLSLAEGRTESAKAHLFEAGKSPGSPQLKTFGPDMSLARDLLLKGEREVVLTYFKLCAKFWMKKFSKLPEWTKEVQNGRIPDFGGNLGH